MKPWEAKEVVAPGAALGLLELGMELITGGSKVRSQERLTS